MASENWEVSGLGWCCVCVCHMWSGRGGCVRACLLVTNISLPNEADTPVGFALTDCPSVCCILYSYVVELSYTAMW